MNNIISLFWRQYRICEKRMVEFSEYVSIDKKNYPTFSDRLLSQYLFVCTTVDSVADEICKTFGVKQKERFGITNKINTILEHYDNLKHWRCSTLSEYQIIHIEPFFGFNENDSAEWWKSYNKVKHFLSDADENGIPNYELANLKNVLFALAALYLLLNKLNDMIPEEERIEIKSDLFKIEII